MIKYEIFSKGSDNSVVFVLKKFWEVVEENGTFTYSSFIAESSNYSWVRNIKFLLEKNITVTPERIK